MHGSRSIHSKVICEHMQLIDSEMLAACNPLVGHSSCKPVTLECSVLLAVPLLAWFIVMLTNVITCGMVGGKVSHLYMELVQALGLDKYPTHAEFFQVTLHF